MSTHTPGEWIIDRENNLIHADDPRHTIVCSFAASMRNPDVMADANLIAAAPTLLAALQAILERIDIAGGLGEYKGGPAFAIKDARAAYRKATEGTTP